MKYTAEEIAAEEARIRWEEYDAKQKRNGGAARATDWRSHVFTAAALRTMDFPAVSYIVPGIIPEGLTILAGRPKIGKSWMALDLAIGIATGKTVLGGVHVEQGDVLYCCLEDNPRRLKRRVTKLLGAFGGEWPERLTLATRWRRLDQGGVEDIEAWSKSVPLPRLVLLDTLAGVRPARAGSDTLYEGDYRALSDVHRFSNERGMGAVALHHTRKMEAEDPVDTISGSFGLAGQADTCLILARSNKGTTLYVRGRDIEECERAITFGSENCKWTLLGDAAEFHWKDSEFAAPAGCRAADARARSADRVRRRRHGHGQRLARRPLPGRQPGARRHARPLARGAADPPPRRGEPRGRCRAAPRAGARDARGAAPQLSHDHALRA